MKTLIDKFLSLLRVYQSKNRRSMVDFCLNINPDIKENRVGSVIEKMIGLSSVLNNTNSDNYSIQSQAKRNLNPIQLQDRKDIIERLRQGKVTISDIFKATDMDLGGNGSISKGEFVILARRLNVTLSVHRVDEIFATVNKSVGNNLGSEELNEDEFVKAFTYIRDKLRNNSIMFLGISKDTLFLFLIALSVCLLLLIIFILVGVSTFTKPGSSFNAVINSTIVTSKCLGTASCYDNYHFLFSFKVSSAGFASKKEDESQVLEPEKVESAVMKSQGVVNNE
jgi:hypothetical protein